MWGGSISARTSQPLARARRRAIFRDRIEAPKRAPVVLKVGVRTLFLAGPVAGQVADKGRLLSPTLPPRYIQQWWSPRDRQVRPFAEWDANSSLSIR